ncbi:MAG TPA: N-acetyltransferase [Xanthobacteraceae bacterium]|nr:N-acetyltransferase [Xanthobacteraceae bacterium]
MIRIEREAPAEAGARESLLDLCLGRRRRKKTSERLREGRLPADGLSFSARAKNGRLIGTVRLWHVAAGREHPALLLGPLAVHPAHQGRGIGSALMRAAIEKASTLGHRAVLLVGDEPYYKRFGFSSALTGELRMPGPFERDRFLALELVPNALFGARGLVVATGEIAPVVAEKSTGIAVKSLTSRVRRAS